MTTTTSTAELRAVIEERVYAGALALDERRFGDWLSGAAAAFRYRIQAYSPELRKDMTWLDHDRAGLSALIELLPKHHTTGADWLRQVVVGSVGAEGEGARAVSSLTVYQTALDVGDSHVDGGSSTLYLVGRYHDRFRIENGEWRLTERVVRLATRQLGIGSHFFP
jgi:methanesulfonate monooxygenase small subunit